MASQGIPEDLVSEVAAVLALTPAVTLRKQLLQRLLSHLPLH